MNAPFIPPIPFVASPMPVNDAIWLAFADPDITDDEFGALVRSIHGHGEDEA